MQGRVEEQFFQSVELRTQKIKAFQIKSRWDSKNITE